MNDNLNIFSEERKKCYIYLNQLRWLMKSKQIGKDFFELTLEDAYNILTNRHRNYKGTAIKTRELEEGVYNIQFWFRCGYTNVTWHEGFTARSVY